MRARFQGSGVETNKYPAELRIDFDELQKMVEALAGELRVCYQVLNEHKLLKSIAEAKRKTKEGINAGTDGKVKPRPRISER